MKKYKGIIFCLLIFIIAFQVFFWFVATNNAYDKNIYFSSQSAVKNWGLKSDEVLFEFSDENFYIAFDNNKNIKSARKDFGFWVRSKFDSFFESSVNEIYTVTVKDAVYVYGTTSEKNAKKVTLVDNLLNEVKAEFKGDFVFDLNSLCFCLKINKKDLLLAPYSVEVIDSNNCIIPRAVENNKKAISIAQTILNTQPKISVFSTANEENHSKKLEVKKNEKLYLSLENDEFVLQTHKESIEFYFYNDYVLLTKKLNVFTARNSAHSKTNSTSYCETYKLDYTDELQELLKIS